MGDPIQIRLDDDARCREQLAKTAKPVSEPIFFADVHEEDLIDFFDYGTLLGN